jgi:AcrR family transcriptional regulator
MFIATARDGLVADDYRRTCPIAGVALDLTAADGVLAGHVADAFGRWRELIGGALTRDGVPPGRARALAALVVAAVEGALLLSRADRSTAALDDAGAELVAHLTAAVAGSVPG